MTSIITKYGDTLNAPTDCRTIYKILGRQGVSLLIDCIAEDSGTKANKFKLSASEREALINSLANELNEALKERL